MAVITRELEFFNYFTRRWKLCKKNSIPCMYLTLSLLFFFDAFSGTGRQQIMSQITQEEMIYLLNEHLAQWAVYSRIVMSFYHWRHVSVEWVIGLPIVIVLPIAR